MLNLSLGVTSPAVLGGAPATGGDPLFSEVVFLVNWDNEVVGEISSTTELSSNASTIALEYDAQFIDSVADPFGGSEVVLDLDGGLDAINVPYRANLRLTGAFTIEMFVRFDSSITGILAGMYDASGTDRNWIMYVSGGNIAWGVGKTGGTVEETKTFTWGTGATNTWYHIAVTRDDSDDVRAFIDGVQLGAAQNQPLDGDGSDIDVKFGKFGFSGAELNGKFGPIRITNGSARYTEAFTVPETFFPTS